MEEAEENNVEMEDETELNPFKASSSKTRPGIIYLSTVPARMNVAQIQQVFSEFGDVGRIYLARDKQQANRRGFKKNPLYKEGWVEFLDKKVAKSVARDLNCTPVGRKKHTELWNIKYLSRFSWTNLNERQEKEKELRKQKRRFGVEYAKKITSNFVQNIATGKKKQKEVSKDCISYAEKPHKSPFINEVHEKPENDVTFLEQLM